MANDEVKTGGDLAQYVTNNNTVLTVDNYNDADALVFAQLSYAKFETNENITKDMTVREFADALLKQTDSNSEQKPFLESIVESTRYSECKVVDFAAENEESQWAALTIQMEKDNEQTAVVAMRGTDGTTKGWVEDLELFYDSDGTRAQELSAEYLKKVNAEQIYLTGHSKGGNDVMSAYVMNDADVRERVCQITNFDGPGVNPEFKNNPDYAQAYGELEDKVHNIYPYNSVIGKLLNDNPGKSTYIDCDTEGHTEIPILGTHDPFSFKIDENGQFVEEENIWYSQVINSLVDGGMNALSNEERRNVVTVLVNLGVPAIIAGKDEGNPYVNDNGIIQKIAHALAIWKQCPEEYKEDIKKFIVLGFVSGAVKGVECAADFVVEKVGEVKQVIYDGYNRFVNGVIGLGKEMVAAIKDFGKGVAEKAQDVWQDVKNYIEKYTGRTSNHNEKNSGMAIGGVACFSMHVASLRYAEQEITNSAKSIRQYKGQVQKVQRELGNRYGYLLSRIVDNLEQVGGNCDNYGKALSDIATVYENTEKKLCV